MRLSKVFTVVLVVCAVSVGFAQAQKISNVADYANAMKMIGGAFGAVNKAIMSGAFADAKTQLDRKSTRLNSSH